jgi:hypothetical protein
MFSLPDTGYGVPSPARAGCALQDFTTFRWFLSIEMGKMKLVQRRC